MVRSGISITITQMRSSVSAAIPVISLAVTGFFQSNYEGLVCHTYYKYSLSMLKQF